MIANETIESWINGIGNYELQKDSPQEQVDVGFAIDHYLTADAQRKLYADCHEDPEPMQAREAFIRFIATKYQNVKRDESLKEKTVDLEAFLGKEGLKLYKAAVEEEGKSKAFRDAVFFKSLKHFPGKKWSKRLILWVGGPSSSGKTYGAKGAIEHMDRDILQKTDQDGGNDVVSVDGSFEREISQTRQMALQFALAVGYKGIQNLHEHSKALVVKNHVKNAALEDGRLSLVIPDTFVRSPGGVKADFETYEKLDAVQAFAEVREEKGFRDRFQTSVKKMGDSRAWNSKAFNPEQISLNNRAIGCESKVYQGSYFKLGLNGTKLFKTYYKYRSRDKINLTIMNDLIYLVRDDKNGWRECEYHDNLDAKHEGVDFLRMTARAYNYWKANHANEPLDQWYSKHGKSRQTLTQQVITCKKNQKYFKHSALWNLLNFNGIRPNFFSNKAENKRRLQHQISVNEESIEALEKEIAKMKDLGKAESLQKKLKQYQLLQRNLKSSLEQENTKSAKPALENIIQNSPEFIPYVDGYVDILAEEKKELLEADQFPIAQPKPAVMASDSRDTGEFLAPALEKNKSRVHYVDITSGTSPRAMFIEEKFRDQTTGVKLTAVEKSVAHDPESLFEYALVMASRMLLSLNKAPSLKEPVLLFGGDKKLLPYLWTALVVLGEKSALMKFGIKEIAIVTPCFSAAQEMLNKKEFKTTSLHETFFKDHEDFVNAKAKELDHLLRLKADPEAQLSFLGEGLAQATRQAWGG
ncbi:hypothetical protein [Legionella jordanis]|uniref:Interaptin n=1 Tax=Legionella jordanis TaxID=456 RepID=A0A0W0VDS4_9GAMM|nr:hypothetical protein [Legionella jordanis]KTD18300.1 interaptin [Legionella jordanis]RMX05218.1 hypothetical protein EAW55_00705 [Legionella jordanis]RMX20931.1 hypothetical protein EAS68_06335 [Legionella jordanis]VEH13355.1 interaptin [Legionella jordanis]